MNTVIQNILRVKHKNLMDTKQWFDPRSMTVESQAQHLVLKINKIQILHNGEQKKKTIIFQPHLAILVSLCGLFHNAACNSNHMTLSWICLQRQMKTIVNIRLVSGLGYEPSTTKIKMTDSSQSLHYLISQYIKFSNVWYLVSHTAAHFCNT